MVAHHGIPLARGDAFKQRVAAVCNGAQPAVHRLWGVCDGAAVSQRQGLEAEAHDGLRLLAAEDRQ